MEKPIQQKQKSGTVTSLNDTTLTKVTYGKYATRDPDEVAYGIYEWFSSQLNTLLHIIKLDIKQPLTSPMSCLFYILQFKQIRCTFKVSLAFMCTA